jgi:hypothetical protein
VKAKWLAITTNQDQTVIYTAGHSFLALPGLPSTEKRPFAAAFSTESYSYLWSRQFKVSDLQCQRIAGAAIDRNQEKLALVGDS